jgi:CRISPR-associated protein Cas1
MKPLHLGGYGVKVCVRNLSTHSELEVTNGRIDDREYSVAWFRPRRFPYSSVVIDGHSGYISLQAFHWLSRNKVPVFIMNFDGSIISSVLPPMPVKANLRVAQFQAANDPTKKLTVAKAFVQPKIVRSLQVLDWLGQRYDIEREVLLTRREASKFSQASSVSQVRTIEGRWLCVTGRLSGGYCLSIWIFRAE